MLTAPPSSFGFQNFWSPPLSLQTFPPLFPPHYKYIENFQGLNIGPNLLQPHFGTFGSSFYVPHFPHVTHESPKAFSSVLDTPPSCGDGARRDVWGLTMIKVYLHFLSRINHEMSLFMLPFSVMHPDISSSDSGIFFVKGVKMEDIGLKPFPDSKTWNCKF